MLTCTVISGRSYGDTTDRNGGAGASRSSRKDRGCGKQVEIGVCEGVDGCVRAWGELRVLLSVESLAQ